MEGRAVGEDLRRCRYIDGKIAYRLLPLTFLGSAHSIPLADAGLFGSARLSVPMNGRISALS